MRHPHQPQPLCEGDASQPATPRPRLRRPRPRPEKARVTVRYMAPTLGEPDSPEICPTNAYFKLFRWRPTRDHLVAHQPQPQSQ